MAKARSQITEKTRMIEETYMEKTGVILELTVKEAEVLAVILGYRTGGSNDDVMNIYRALKKEVNVYSESMTQMNSKIDGFLKVPG